MDLNLIGIQLLNGLLLSILLFMLAVGLSVVFGLLDILNLAHCTLYMFGAYIGLTLSNTLGSFWLALLFTPLLVVLIGAGLYSGLLQRLKADHLLQALVTFALIFIGYDVARMIWGVEIHRIVEPAVLSGGIPLFGLTYPVYRLFLIAVGVAIVIGLYLGLERTRLGAIVRAGVDDRETTALLGINIDRAFFVVFCLGAALAGLAGVIVGPVLPIEPGMDVGILIQALVVVVIGGPGSLKGTVLGALLIGLAETFGQILVPEFSSFIMFFIMAVVLLWKPQGLLPVKAVR